MTQFNYCPLIWMCHRTYNNKINRLHEKCLPLIYNDKRSSFESLLEKDNSVSIHHKNLEALAMEMLKLYTKTSPEIMQETFLVKEQGNYNLRNQTDFVIPQVKSVNRGLESIWLLGPKIWKTCKLFKKIKNWLIVLKLPLRDGNLNYVLAVFVKLIYRT